MNKNPPGLSLKLSSIKRYPGTQIGVAHLFCDIYQNKARFNFIDGNWYIFDESAGWKKDESGAEIFGLIDELSSALYDAGKQIHPKEKREEYHKNYCSQLTSTNKINRLLDAASKFNAFSANALDGSKDVLGTMNGVITLNLDGTYAFSEFSPEHMITRHMDAVYDPNATCPTWEKFIDEVLGGDQENIKFFKIFLGQTLYGRNHQKAFGILYGPSTNNGKSTLTNALKDLFGDYAVTVNKDLITKKKQMSASDYEQIAKTHGTRLVTLPEPDQDTVVDVSTIKNLTGNAPISARRLYQHSFEFVPAFTLLIDTNHKLWMRDNTIFTRGSVIMFMFNQMFTGSRADSTLDEKLKGEFSGILNWLLEGWKDYCTATQGGSKHWNIPKSMDKALKEYCNESDPISQFISDNFVVTGNQNNELDTKSAYKIYSEWCRECGRQPKNNTSFQADFRKHLTDLLRKQLNISGPYDENYSKRKDSSGKRYYWGIEPTSLQARIHTK